MKGAASCTCSQERSESEPIIQNMISVAAKGLGDRFSASAVSAPHSAESATPARISVSAPPRAPASPSSIAAAVPAPTSASSGSASGTSAESPV